MLQSKYSYYDDALKVTCMDAMLFSTHSGIAHAKFCTIRMSYNCRATLENLSNSWCFRAAQKVVVKEEVREEYMEEVEEEEVKSTFTSIARQTSNQMRMELRLKSDEELRETAGKAAGKTALALVSVTARYS